MDNFIYFSGDCKIENFNLIKSADCLVLGKGYLKNSFDELKFGMIGDVLALDSPICTPSLENLESHKEHRIQLMKVVSRV